MLKLHPRLIQHAAAMQSSQQVIRPDQEDKEGNGALGLPRQVLGRRANLAKAAALGVVEPEEETTTSDEEMQEEIREGSARHIYGSILLQSV